MTSSRTAWYTRGMFAALAIVLAHPHETVTPRDLGTLTVPQARQLRGRVVLVTLEAEVPPFTQGGNAHTGYLPDVDGTVRRVVVAGAAEDHDLRIGQRLIVVGRLDVIDHSAVVRGGARFPAYSELRVVGRLASEW